MKNSNLFNTNTIRLRCFGCGRLFDITELKQCSACKELFCAECQNTHDCTADTPGVPAALIPVPLITERDAPAPMSDDEAYSAYVRSLNPFIECEECGEAYPQSDMWKCPDCGIVLCQICREKHRCPKPEHGKKGVLAFLPVLGSKIAERSSDIQETEGEGDGRGDADEEQIVCDGCGKAHPKSKMRRCQNCGAVLCPKCRILHSCGKSGDKKRKEEGTKEERGKEERVKEERIKEERVREEKTMEERPDEETPGKTTVPAVSGGSSKEKNGEEQIVCDGCGESFPKSKMRKCRECGDVLCPKCRKKHVCRTKRDEI